MRKLKTVRTLIATVVALIITVTALYQLAI